MIHMIPLPSQPKIIQKKGNTALFEIEGLYPGYGVTIGNSLRRVLFSSLEGAAITEVKIKGVAHEFSTLPGVLEDVVMILLNLKKLRFRSFAQEPQIATLNVKGEKEVKGKDFKLPPQVEIANPQSHIATLTKSQASLNMEVKIEKGVGYEPVERREIKKKEIGVIPIDAIFTPVKRVGFWVENMRVGKRTDFDRLKIEIETDGTLSPEEALKEASEILLNHFSLLSKISEKKSEKEISPKEKKEEEKEDIRKMKIEELKVSERTKNALVKNGIRTVGGLLRKSERDLLNLEGLGEKGVEEIKKVLKKLNLKLKDGE
ncbi:MAG: DNA-directed RNA polymerase subunit alpha [Candidatus Nealsonbacteria bacterium]|nr:MAG: DNA-directed RNA polymerase subunit alpha [Candidatus Nealsonbacteria bacterium]